MQRSPFERLIHRWFVQYNPLYLLSATLVLAGLTLLSISTPRDGSTWSYVGVGAVSELYALALIGGAALLTRLELPRPATMVALIAVVYQGDLALNTETLPHMHHGALASLLWVAVFVVKLRLLAWALKLRLSRSALLVPTLGALGVAFIPHLVAPLGSDTLTSVVGLWLFAIYAAALWTTREVTSSRALDAWGTTVKRRALVATWAIFGVLAAAHAVVWFELYHLEAAIVAPVILLLSTRWMRGELAVLVSTTATLVFVGATSPSLLPATALMAAAVFALHALRRPTAPASETTTTRSEYRGLVDSFLEEVPPFELAPDPERTRELAWAGYSFYLALSTARGHHVVVVELLLATVMLIVALRRKNKTILLPLAATSLHWAVVSRLVRAPKTTSEWALAALSLGFGLLFLGVFTSWRFSRPTPRSDHSPGLHA